MKAREVQITATVELVPVGWDEIRNTHLVGRLEATYDEIVAALGEPERYDEAGLKIDAEWRVKDARGSFGVLTIYNHKTGPNYLGDEGTPVEEITTWSLGGRNAGALLIARALFGDRVQA